MGWCASHWREAKRDQTGLGDLPVLRLAATGDADGTYALTVLDDGQAAAKGDKSRA